MERPDSDTGWRPGRARQSRSRQWSRLRSPSPVGSAVSRPVDDGIAAALALPKTLGCPRLKSPRIVRVVCRSLSVWRALIPPDMGRPVDDPRRHRRAQLDLSARRQEPVPGGSSHVQNHWTRGKPPWADPASCPAKELWRLFLPRKPWVSPADGKATQVVRLGGRDTMAEVWRDVNEL